MIDLNQHDRFVVTCRRRITTTPTLDTLDVYEFALADADADAAPVCHVRQRVARASDRVGFFADEARTVALMYLDPGPRSDPWARRQLTDASLHAIGAIQKQFSGRRRRSHYVLYGAAGDEIARVEARVPAAVTRRRAARVVVAAGAGALGLPLIGAARVVAVASLAATVAIRHVRDWVDPLDVASQLRLVRGDDTLGIVLRLPTIGFATPRVPWATTESCYEIDMTADPERTVDRRLVLAVPVALDALRGVFAH
jgi:hypothetical protein